MPCNVTVVGYASRIDVSHLGVIWCGLSAAVHQASLYSVKEMEPRVTRGAGGRAGRAVPTLMVDGMVQSQGLTDTVADIEQRLGSGSSQHARKMRTPNQFDQAAATATAQSTIATSMSERASPAYAA